MTEEIIHQGEERYVQVFKWNARYKRALATSVKRVDSIYHIRYLAHLNGHIILDETIARDENPYHIMELPNGYKCA